MNGSAGNIVTQLVRKYGLGDLLQVTISPDGQWMATSGSSGAFFWNFQTGTVLHRLEAHHRRVLSICFSPDSQLLLTGGGDAVIRAWDVNSGIEIRSLTGHLLEIQDIAFAPDEPASQGRTGAVSRGATAEDLLSAALGHQAGQNR